MRKFFRWFRQFRARRYHWQEARFQEVLSSVPALKALSEAEVVRLRELAREFLVDKVIHPAGGMRMSERIRVAIATLACLPALHLGYEVLSGWYDIVVYPDTFIATRERTDGHGVVHQERQVLHGEAWSRGPIVLSAARIEAELAEPDRAQSVILHEIAHKIDGLDASVDGVPPLPFKQAQTFYRSLRAAHAQLNYDLYAGFPRIDPYAAQSPEEFFAVSSELYFLAPQRLSEAFPDYFQVVDNFYRPPA